MLGPREFFETAFRTKYIQAVHDRVGVGFKFLIAIPVDELVHLGDPGCVWILQPGAPAFLPVFDQVEAHLTGPAHTAFHEAKIKAWITVHETAEENTTRESVVRFSEVADVVVSEVVDRRAILPAPAA